MKKTKPLIPILLVSLGIGCASPPAGLYYYEEGFSPLLKPEIENNKGQTLATGSVSAAYGMGNIQGDYQQTAGGSGALTAAPAVAPSAGTFTYPPTGETFQGPVLYTASGAPDILAMRNRKFGPSAWGHWPIFRSASDQANYYAWERQYGGEGLSYLNPYKPIRYTDTPRKGRAGAGDSITGTIDYLKTNK
jgi:hypothetical protein